MRYSRDDWTMVGGQGQWGLADTDGPWQREVESRKEGLGRAAARGTLGG